MSKFSKQDQSIVNKIVPATYDSYEWVLTDSDTGEYKSSELAEYRHRVAPDRFSTKPVSTHVLLDLNHSIRISGDLLGWQHVETSDSWQVTFTSELYSDIEHRMSLNEMITRSWSEANDLRIMFYKQSDAELVMGMVQQDLDSVGYSGYVKYILGFYGVGGTWGEFFKDVKLTAAMVHEVIERVTPVVNKQQHDPARSDENQYRMGDNSIDREIVRDVMLHEQRGVPLADLEYDIKPFLVGAVV